MESALQATDALFRRKRSLINVFPMASRMFHPESAAFLAAHEHVMLKNTRDNVFPWNNQNNTRRASLLAEVYTPHYALVSERTADAVQSRPILMDCRVHLPLTIDSSVSLPSRRLHTGEITILTPQKWVSYSVNIKLFTAEMICADNHPYSDRQLEKAGDAADAVAASGNESCEQKRHESEVLQATDDHVFSSLHHLYGSLSLSSSSMPSSSSSYVTQQHQQAQEERQQTPKSYRQCN